MIQTPSHIYDVFVAYSLGDRSWVQDDLVPRLLAGGFHILADHRNPMPGDIKARAEEHPIWRSRVILLVLSSHTNGDKAAHLEAMLSQLAQGDGRKPRVLVALLEPCELGERLAQLQPIDFTRGASRGKQMRRLLRRLGRKRRVFIAYQRDAERDAALAGQLAAHLEHAGHKVARGQELLGETEWDREASRAMAASDYLIALLSATSAQSELVASQIEYAHKQFLEHGRPKVLPVRVDYQETLPYQIDMYLDRLPYAAWRGRRDTRRLIVQLCDALGYGAALPLPTPATRRPQPSDQALRPPLAHADLRFAKPLDTPGGAIPPGAASYVEREADAKLRRILRSPGGVTATIRAPRQSGKSSLLMRGLALVQAQGGKTVFIDLQPIDSVFLDNLDAFLSYLATTIVDQLGLDRQEVEAVSSSQLGSTNKLTNLVKEYILPRMDTKIALAIDETDRLLSAGYGDVFFGMLRSWHNDRARNELWNRLDVLMVVASEPYAPFHDPDQSPFHAGEMIELEDFDADQVAALNLRYLSPVGERDMPDLLALLGGHPYLTSRALYTMQVDGLRWDGLRRVAASDRGPFGDHLRHYLWTLRDQKELRGAIKQIIDHGRCSDERLFLRLVKAGLAKGVDGSSCALRCALYESYFREKLRSG
jgi:hypothetical protein